MRARQKVSRAGVELIKSFEGLRQSATQLPDGRWMIGYGHTFSAREGAKVTPEDADALLRFDLLPVVDGINNLVHTALTQNQFDALVSFSFSVGLDNFATSDVLRRINEGRLTEAALNLDTWNSAEFNGQTYVLAPLIRRRAAEKSLFLTPDAGGAEPDLSLMTPGMMVRPGAQSANALSASPEPAPVKPTIVRVADVSESPAPATTDVQSVLLKAEQEARIQDEFRRLEAVRLAEAQKREAERRVAEDTRRQEEARRLEEARRAEERRLADEARAREDARLREEARRLEALRLDEEARVREEMRQREEARVREEMRQREEARIREEVRQREDARIREEVRLREEALRQETMLQAQALAAARAAEEARLSDLRRIEEARYQQQRLEAEARAREETARQERERQERERLEQERLEKERLEQERQAAEARAREEAARLEAERIEQERIENEKRLEAERAEAERQKAEQARLEQERLEQERLEQQRLEAEAKERQARQQAEAVRANPALVDMGPYGKPLAAPVTAPAPPAALSMPASPPEPDKAAEAAEAARKAEAAAALMRLYSPYGSMSGSLLKPKPAVAPTPPQPQAQPHPTTPPPAPFELSSRPEPTPPKPVAPTIEMPDEDDDSETVGPSLILQRKGDSNLPRHPSLVAPPTVVASPTAKPEIVEVPEPPRTAPTEANGQLHWREQYQHPVGSTAGEAGLSLNSAAQAATTPYVDESYAPETDEWIGDDGRIALSSDVDPEAGTSLWKMITSTLQWIVISVIGLAALGGATAAYQRARDANIIGNGRADFFTHLSITLAVAGIFCVCVSVWLIFKRLGGLKD